MNKLLTTITLLCLPVVSFAEIYLCTSQKEATVMDPEVNGRSWFSISGDADGQVIVDTSRGFRPNASWDDYVGQCERTDDLSFRCTYDPPGSIWLLSITETSRSGAIFGLSHTSSFAISAVGGTCTKA